MAEQDDASNRGLKSVGRAFDIIEFIRGEGPVTLSSVANSFDLPMSTAHIHLATLVETGYVVKEDGEYRCGLRFLRNGGELRDRMALFRVAKSEVDDLQQTVGEIANVATMEDWYMVQLYKSESPDSIDDNAPLGAHLYLHATANGKAMLAERSASAIDSLIDTRGLPAATEETITTEEALRDELERTRERGYAVNREENFVGVCAVAVPIISKSGVVRGAISVSGPLSRMGQDRVEDDIVPKLSEKRNLIELKLQQL